MGGKSKGGELNYDHYLESVVIHPKFNYLTAFVNFPNAVIVQRTIPIVNLISDRSLLVRPTLWG